MYDGSTIGVKKDKKGNVIIDHEESRSTDDGGEL